LHLTLDTRLQYILRDEVRQVVEEFEARAASALIMDVKSGALLAGMSWPDFDPNHAGQAPSAARFNRLSLGVYELGSVFKIFSTAALLEEGAHFARQFDAREPLQHGAHKIRDYHAEERVLNVPEVFIHSSNIGSALMGEALGTKKLKSYYRDLGLLEETDFSLQEVGAPIIPRPWRDINTLTASYGHGIAVSPLQLASAVATTIGDGTRKEPHFLKNTPGRSADLRVFSPKTVEQMRGLLRLTVTDGTGHKGDVPGYQVGGKTGTAEKPGANGYDLDKKISSFVSVFPMHDPRYLVLVVVDEPKGNARTYNYATGGWVAAPATARIVSHMTRILGIQPAHAQQEFIKPYRAYLKTSKDMAHAAF
jgi:cell division protein FtsI (penicillin-binding protein 3)